MLGMHPGLTTSGSIIWSLMSVRLQAAGVGELKPLLSYLVGLFPFLFKPRIVGASYNYFPKVSLWKIASDSFTILKFSPYREKFLYFNPSSKEFLIGGVALPIGWSEDKLSSKGSRHHFMVE
jgi:hypothetical protein